MLSNQGKKRNRYYDPVHTWELPRFRVAFVLYTQMTYSSRLRSFCFKRTCGRTNCNTGYSSKQNTRRRPLTIPSRARFRTTRSVLFQTIGSVANPNSSLLGAIDETAFHSTTIPLQVHALNGSHRFPLNGTRSWTFTSVIAGIVSSELCVNAVRERRTD